ncbi:MAG: hypothetical protein AAGF73_18630 [Actinomycetota bacterium]
MLTVLWAAKGGTGTTFVSCALALDDRRTTLLVDLDGDIPNALGLPSNDRPGAHDWLRSDAPPEHLADLLVSATDNLVVLPAHPANTERSGEAVAADRWAALADWCSEWHARGQRNVVIDAGTGSPPESLIDVADHALLVTRRCYLALSAARRVTGRATGVVLIDEDGRTLPRRGVTETTGAPIAATVRYDRTAFQALDAGLLHTPLPRAIRRHLAPLVA